MEQTSTAPVSISYRSRVVEAEELGSLRLHPMGKKHPVKQWLDDLAVGNALLVYRSDFRWKGRKTPRPFVKQIEDKTDKRFEILKLADKSGWAVKRIS